MVDHKDHKYSYKAWLSLYVLFGLVGILSGLDKFLGLLANWEMYVSPFALSILPMSAAAFISIVGVVEIIAGGLTFWKPKLGGAIIGVWLILIALNLLTFNFYSGPVYNDIVVRDLGLAVAAFCLAFLSKQEEIKH